LQQLARALTVPVSAFFATEPPRQHVGPQRATQRPQALFAHGLLEDLAAGLVNRIIEPLLVTLRPHASSGTDSIVHTGQEFVYCLAGRIAYTAGDQTFLLEPGDSLTFDAHLPHRWQNVADVPAQALLVLCPLDARDRPAERHFAGP
jgi:quercetin dioxygenase-like cupin family protein